MTADNGVDIESFDVAAQCLKEQGRTVMWVTHVDARPALLGLITVADPIKATARKAVQRLQEIGIETILLTDDTKRTASSVATQVASIASRQAFFRARKRTKCADFRRKGTAPAGSATASMMRQLLRRRMSGSPWARVPTSPWRPPPFTLCGRPTSDRRRHRSQPGDVQQNPPRSVLGLPLQRDWDAARRLRPAQPDDCRRRQPSPSRGRRQSTSWVMLSLRSRRFP